MSESSYITFAPPFCPSATQAKETSASRKTRITLFVIGLITLLATILIVIFVPHSSQVGTIATYIALGLEILMILGVAFIKRVKEPEIIKKKEVSTTQQTSSASDDESPSISPDNSQKTSPSTPILSQQNQTSVNDAYELLEYASPEQAAQSGKPLGGAQVGFDELFSYLKTGFEEMKGDTIEYNCHYFKIEKVKPHILTIVVNQSSLGRAGSGYIQDLTLVPYGGKPPIRVAKSAKWSESTIGLVLQGYLLKNYGTDILGTGRFRAGFYGCYVFLKGLENDPRDAAHITSDGGDGKLPFRMLTPNGKFNDFGVLQL
jgi:hypothetical protein